MVREGSEGKHIRRQIGRAMRREGSEGRQMRGEGSEAKHALNVMSISSKVYRVKYIE
jgi:hypothetical protein